MREKSLVERMVASGFPRQRIVNLQLLTDGFCNTSLRVHLRSRPEPIVLRIYKRDPAACQKEIDLLQLVSSSVPVPEILHAEPHGIEGSGPFLILQFVEGITFRQLDATRDPDACAEAARSIGATLAAIGRYRFAGAGRLEAGPAVGAPLLEGSDSMPRFVDHCLASPVARARTGDDLIEKLHEHMWARAPQLAALAEERSLVHSDFSSRNLIVCRVDGRWRCVAVLDWEFAFSGTPLADVGHFLRYEPRGRPVREPHFSCGFGEAGGMLMEGWMDLARAVDLTALCELLTHGDLPDDVVPEVLDRVRATIEARDPE